MKAGSHRMVRPAARIVFAVVLAGCGGSAASSGSASGGPVASPATSAAGSEAAAGSSDPARRADDGARIVAVKPVGDRLVDLQIDSPAMEGETSARVLLPASFEKQPERTWPVLYMLHGATTPDALSSFTRHPEFLAMLATAEVIVVTPYAGDYGYYSDWWNDGEGGPPRWETFHLVELRQLLERNYRACGKWAIGGISMGGFGAISYAGRHPGMFVAAASFSGVLDTTQATWQFEPRLWGDKKAQADVFRAHNPVDVAEGLRGTSLYIAYGNGAAGPLDAPGTGTDSLEATLARMNDRFVARLRELGIEATVNAYGPGTHTWGYWSREFGVWLPAALRALGA